MRYCIVLSGLVTTVAKWDGVTPWAGSATAMPCDREVGPGWVYTGGARFEAPPADVAEDPVDEDVSKLTDSELLTKAAASEDPAVRALAELLKRAP